MPPTKRRISNRLTKGRKRNSAQKSPAKKSHPASAHPLIKKRCANCHRIFNDKVLPTRRFVSRVTDEEDLVMSIREALRKILFWADLDSEEKIIWQEELLPVGDIQVCHDCGLAIGKVFGSIRVFDQMRRPLSEVSKIINELNKLERNEKNTAVYEESLKKPKEESENYDELERKIKKRESSPIFENEGPDYSGPNSPDNNGDDGCNDGDYDPSVENIKKEKKTKTKKELEKEAKKKEEEEEMDKLMSTFLDLDQMPPSPRAAGPPKPICYDNKSFLCDHCPKGFGTSQGLRVHLLLTHEVGNKSKNHVCSFCGRAYFYEYLLNNHMKVHSDERTYSCSICSSLFKTLPSLQHHIKNVHNAMDRPFKCDQCDRAYKEARSLREHVNLKHGAFKGIKIHVCKHCGFRSARKRTLLTHERRCVKNPERSTDKIPCSYECGKLFNYEKGMKKHKLICTNRLKYEGVSFNLPKKEEDVHSSQNRSSDSEGDSSSNYQCSYVPNANDYIEGSSNAQTSIFTNKEEKEIDVTDHAEQTEEDVESYDDSVKNVPYRYQSNMEERAESANIPITILTKTTEDEKLQNDSDPPDNRAINFFCPYNCGKILNLENGGMKHSLTCPNKNSHTVADSISSNPTPSTLSKSTNKKKKNPQKSTIEDNSGKKHACPYGCGKLFNYEGSANRHKFSCSNRNNFLARNSTPTSVSHNVIGGSDYAERIGDKDSRSEDYQMEEGTVENINFDTIDSSFLFPL